MDKSDKCLIAILILSGLLILIGISFSGCALLPTQESDTISEPLTKVINRTNWLATLSIIGMAASFFALLNGFKWGFAGMASCGLALFTSLATIKYAGVMSICGLIGSICIMIGSVLIKNKALIEIIKGVEFVKSDPTIPKNTVNSCLDTDQSMSTKSIVKKIKSKI